MTDPTLPQILTDTCHCVENGAMLRHNPYDPILRHEKRAVRMFGLRTGYHYDVLVCQCLRCGHDYERPVKR